MPAHALRTVPHGEIQPPHDGLLHLARNFNKPPDTLIGDGNSILGTGMPGAGKTTVLALLLEQFGFCGIPFAAFDLEGDLRSVVDLLPRGVLATPDNCPTAEEMYRDGLQVVFDLGAWGDDSNRAASLIVRTVNGLHAHMKALPLHLRVPFLVGLDEAAYWLPQVRKGCNHLSAENLSDLFAAFHTLAVRGRKMGLIPMLFTQRFASLHKDVLSPGTYILMRQTADNDLKRYMEYIDASAFGEEDDDITRIQMRQRIAAFKKGQAIVKLPDGKQGTLQFYNRASLHTSHAPKAQAAANLYHNAPFDKSKRYGSEQGDSGANAGTPTSPATSNVRVLPTRETTPTIKAQVYALLERDPSLDVTELATQTGGSTGRVRDYRAEYFYRHPERRAGTAPTLKAQVYALLEQDPSLAVMDLAAQTGGDRHLMRDYRAAYLREHPERRAETIPTLKEQVYILLDQDPSLAVTELATQTGGSVSRASVYRAAYLKEHPERRAETIPTLKEQVYILLDQDPSLAVTELATQTGGKANVMSVYRAEYFNQHPELRRPKP